MKMLLKLKFGIFVIGTLGLTSTLTQAATVAPGPYYATPSWDQQLPASTRFIVLSNWIDFAHQSGGAAVLDRETGLVWEKSPGVILQTWLSAQDDCGRKNIGGRIGWRLPNLQELGTLIDQSRSRPALPPGHPFQILDPNLQPVHFWTATTSLFDPAHAYFIDMGDGRVSFAAKGATFTVWCTRGGPGAHVQ